MDLSVIEVPGQWMFQRSVGVEFTARVGQLRPSGLLSFREAAATSVNGADSASTSSTHWRAS
jgi:hypothetical protein